MDAVSARGTLGHCLMVVFHRHRIVGRATDLHGRDPAADAVPSIAMLEVEGPTVVLGSTQRREVVLAPEELAGRGVDLARRRSGGGLVWLSPGESVWIDVTIGADDERWTDDVGAAFLWLGDLFVEALVASGVEAAAHRGPFIDRGAASVLCFAGLGSGEVTVDGRKLVGMSQRRIRGRARFQIVIYESWQPAELIDVLSPDLVGVDTIARLTEAAPGLGIGCSELGIEAMALVERVFP